MSGFRPTLVIGLGGSGTFVVRRLRKRLQRLAGGVLPQSIQLLAIDTDEQQSIPTLQVLSASEFLRIDDFDGDRIVNTQNKARYPEIATWWRFNRLSPGFVRDGAKQRPPVGRLAMFVKFDRFLQHLESAFQRMFQITSSAYPQDNAGSVDVHVVSSSCGGTGAGVFFDVALIARSLLTTRFGRTPNIQSHVFLPSCFRDRVEEMPSLSANAATFLRTLEGVQRDGLPGISYPQFRAERLPSHLFNRVFLISGTNIEGFGFPDLQHIYEKVALQLDLEISSAAGGDARRTVVNFPCDFNQRARGRMCCYASFGAAQLGGVSEITRWELLPQLIEATLRALLAPAPTPATPNTLSGHKEFAQLGNILTNDLGALELAPDYAAEMQIVRQTRDPKSAVRTLGDRLARIVFGCRIEWLDQLGELASYVDSQVSERLASGSGGVTAATEYLHNIEGEVNGILRLLKEFRDSPVEGPDGIVAKLEGLSGFFANPQGVLERDGMPYLQNQAVIQIRKKIAGAAVSEIQTLSQSIQQLRSALQTFPDTATNITRSVKEYCRQQLDREEQSLGNASSAVDRRHLADEFRRRSASLVGGFLERCRTGKLLDELVARATRGQLGTSWMNALTQSGDEYIREAFSTQDAVTPDWPATAANSILQCKPMVYLTDELGPMQRFPRVAVARVYQSVAVGEELSSHGTDIRVNLVDSETAGSLEVSSAVLNFPLYALQELPQIEDGYRAWQRSHMEPEENRWALRGPDDAYQRLRSVELLPLDRSKEAFARLLAFEPVAGVAIVRELPVTYSIDARPIELPEDCTWYTKRTFVSDTLANTGRAERIIRDLQSTDKEDVRRHLEAIIPKWEKKIADNEQYRLQDDDWDAYVDMLRAELQAAIEASNKIPR